MNEVLRPAFFSVERDDSLPDLVRGSAIASGELVGSLELPAKNGLLIGDKLFRFRAKLVDLLAGQRQTLFDRMLLGRTGAGVRSAFIQGDIASK